MPQNLFLTLIVFAAVLFVVNYFILLKNRPDRMQASVTMTAISAVLFGVIMWFWSAV